MSFGSKEGAAPPSLNVILPCEKGWSWLRLDSSHWGCVGLQILHETKLQASKLTCLKRPTDPVKRQRTFPENVNTLLISFEAFLSVACYFNFSQGGTLRLIGLFAQSAKRTRAHPRSLPLQDRLREKLSSAAAGQKLARRRAERLPWEWGSSLSQSCPFRTARGRRAGRVV